MGAIKLLVKCEKELETLKQRIRIYSKDIGIEFGIEKCTVLICVKREITKVKEQKN